MPAFLHHPALSGNSYLSFVNSCALCSFLQIEAGCYVYASLTPARENVPILTKLLTYFVRGKAVAALKAVHTSQAASHSVGSLQEKGRVIQSGLFFFYLFFLKVKQRRQQLCRWTQDGSGTWYVWHNTTDCGASRGFYRERHLQLAIKPAALLTEVTEYFLIHFGKIAELA